MSSENNKTRFSPPSKTKFCFLSSKLKLNYLIYFHVQHFTRLYCVIAPSGLFLHQYTAENHLWKVEDQVGLKIFKLFTVCLDFFVFFVFWPIWFKEIKGPELILPNLLDCCGRTFSNSVLISLRSFLVNKTPCSTCFKPLSSQRGTKMAEVEESSAKPSEIFKLD